MQKGSAEIVGGTAGGLSEAAEASIAPAFLHLPRALARTARVRRRRCRGENGDNVGEKWKC